MHPKITKGIVLKRTYYGEADRIISFLTEDLGKVNAIAKGVRKEKSRLAGGIEPFSVSELSLSSSRSDLQILTGARLQKYYGNFLGDLEKVNLAYDALKQINKITEENSVEDKSFFNLSVKLFEALESGATAGVIRLWWLVKLSEITGHGIENNQTVNAEKFLEDKNYVFDIENGGFVFADSGSLKAHHIKFLRLTQTQTPSKLCKVINSEDCASDLYPYIKAFTEMHI